MDYNQFKKSVPDSLLAAVDEAMRGSQTSPKTSSGDEKPPFDKPFAKAGPRKDRYGNPVKNVARHLARKGLATHRVAESQDEAYITEGSVGYKHYTITGGQPHDLRNEVGAPEHVAADLRKLKKLGVHANEGDGEKYGHVTKVTVTNNQTGEKSHHHVYQRDMSRNQQRPVFSVRHLSKPHPEHINVLKHYIAGKTKIKDSLGLYETSDLQVEETMNEARPTAASLARKSKAIKQARAVALGYAKQKSGEYPSGKPVKEEAEGLDELTKKTLQSYIAKAGKDRTKQLGNERKYENRMKGSSQAVAKLAKANEEAEIQEKVDPVEAREFLNQHKARDASYFSMRSEYSTALLNHAKKSGYKPSGGSGKSIPRAYHDHLNKLADKADAMKKSVMSVKEETLEESVAKVRKALEAGKLFSDSIGKNKDGHVVVRNGFYYKSGRSAEAQTAKIKRALDDAGVKHTIVKDGEHNAPFRGGASVGRQSHFYTHIKLHEDVESIDEISMQTKYSYVRKADKELPSLFKKGQSDEGSARKYYNRKNTIRKIANEDVESIEELRAATIDSYRKKAYDQQPAGDDGSQLYKKRKTGRDLAFKKVTHGAKIMATEEEVKRGRGRPSKASLEIEDEPEALGMQLRKAKSINKPVTFNNKETKQIDPKHLFAFNNHMDARRTTQEKHAFQKKASASHADFVKAVSEPVPARAKDTGEIIRYGQGRY